MPTVVQLTRKLLEMPQVRLPADVTLRHFGGPEDIEVWLELRRRAFARQRVGVGDWQRADFEREFLNKSWWAADRMWFAQDVSQPGPAVPVGTVTLAQRGEHLDARPVVHWLAVLPGYRRRGVGRLLVSALELAVWNCGQRQIWLETHSQWIEAAKLYRAMGYELA